MIRIKEQIVLGRSSFLVTATDSKGKLIAQNKIDYRIETVTRNGIDYFLLVDSAGRSVHEFFVHLNYTMLSKSPNTRRTAAGRLRKLYEYVDLMGLDIRKLTSGDITNFILFLQKFSLSNGEFRIEFAGKYNPRNNTVNQVLAACRNFFRDLEIDCPALMEIKQLHIRRELDTDMAYQRDAAYKVNLRESHPVVKVPKYVSVEEFKTILGIIRKEGNIMAEIIVRLMFCYGLRLGEVLGLTNEDVTERRITGGDVRPVLYLCNRLSDSNFQLAKNKNRPVTKDGYNSPDYRRLDDYVAITDDFYRFINEYIEVKLLQEMKAKRLEKLRADTVVKDKYAGPNYYIFVGSRGGRLSDVAWNRYLKKVFEQAGIALDKRVRQHNLNHRLRHGYAMFLVKYLHLPVRDVMLRMRHKYVTSSMVYYNPTEADEFELKTRLAETIYDVIPALKETPSVVAGRRK